jgi:exosome complex component RRP41
MGSRRLDVLSLAQLRKDGRRPNEIRRVKIELGCVMNDSCSTGSCLFEMGLTSVLASVMGPTECSRRSEELPDRASVSVQVRMAPFASSSTAMERRIINPTTDRKLLEMSHLLQQVLEASILLTLYPRAKILVHVYILADDGGRLCAAINAVTCALTNAGIGLKDMVCSCSAGLVARSSASARQHPNNNRPLVDLNRIELQSDEDVVYLPCAIMPQRNTIVLAQCESRLNLHSYEEVLTAAIHGCQSIFQIMQSAVKEHSSRLLAARHGNLRVSLRLPHGAHDTDPNEDSSSLDALQSAFSATL